jgi:hypothetical protein
MGRVQKSFTLIYNERIDDIYRERGRERDCYKNKETQDTLLSSQYAQCCKKTSMIFSRNTYPV